jgi:hypothetical protein
VEVKMIVEVRSYRIKSGKREEFIKLFETRAVPALRSYGMNVTGPFLDVGESEQVCVPAQLPFP